MARNYFGNGGEAASVMGALNDGYATAGNIFSDVMGKRAGYRAAPKIASGDYAGASAEYAAHGMADQAMTLRGKQDSADQAGREREAAARKERLEALKWGTSVVGSIPDDGSQAARRQVMDTKVLPAFQAMGFGPDVIEGLRKADLSDPSIKAFGGELQKAEYQLFQSSADGSITAVDKADPRRTIEVRKGRPEPKMYGDYLYLPDGAEDQGRAPQQPAAASPPSAQPSSYRDAIANIESRGSGNYAALGPVTRTGDRAYGRYQVMGANIPQWTREALGREMTPQEFVASPEAQDAVFDHRFGGYVQKYGSPEEAASVWFTGRPRSQGADRRDQLGTSGADYVAKFSQGMGGQNAPLQGGPAGDDLSSAPQIPGMRVVARTKPEQRPEWRADGKGVLVNDRTGDRKADPAFKTSPAPTDADKKATAFAYRTLRANDRLNALVREGVIKPQTATAQLFDTSKNGVVRVVTKTDQDRQFIQAAKEWLAPILRKDTGAAVTDGELATYMDIYIPRFEDDARTLRQKAEARQDAMIALTREAGPLYERTYGRREFKSHYAADRKPQSGNAGWSITPVK